MRYMKKIIVIVGPTAVGKTKLSIELAKKFDGEIINADSTQIFKGLDIATAKVTDKEKENIVHHLIDIKNITDDYTVYDYKFDEESKNTDEYLESTNDELYEMLLKIDPKTEIHKNNRKRVVRAINYYKENKKPLSSKEKTDKELYDTICIGLTTDRKILYDRINKRVDVMVESGLLEEAKKIYESNIRTKAVLTPIGYKELFPYFSYEKSLDECLNLIRQNSRRYAKRQYTWFNNQMKVKWFNTDFSNFDNTIIEVSEYIKNAKR